MKIYRYIDRITFIYAIVIISFRGFFIYKFSDNDYSDTVCYITHLEEMHLYILHDAPRKTA